MSMTRIASEVAVNVDGVITLVAQKTENCIDVFFGRLDWRGADCAGQQGACRICWNFAVPLLRSRAAKNGCPTLLSETLW
jgi:hypothetical protein